MNLTLAQAIVRASEIKACIAAGQDPRAPLLPLGAWFDTEFLPVRTDTHRAWRSDRSRFNAYVRPTLGERPIGQITALDLSRLVEGLAPVRECGRERLAPATVNRVVALLKVVFARLVRDRYLSANPAAGLRLRRERNRRARVLRDEELGRFFAALAVQPPKVRLLLTFLLLTGMRLGEALAARWVDVHVEQRYLRIPDSKSGEPRIIPLSDEGLRVVEELAVIREAGHLYLFPGRQGPMSRPTRQFRALLAAAGIEGVWLHDLRRTFATLAARAIPIHAVSRLLGHSNVTVTQRYVVTLDAELHTAAAFVGRHLDAAWAPASANPAVPAAAVEG